jgi:hypothetical protein
MLVVLLACFTPTFMCDVATAAANLAGDASRVDAPLKDGVGALPR